ncbi:hypothetical protein SLA_1396 [Streptomyces laurentii]|uniref:Uncharacterized protein n=1 Tax=Streptomyces laurentii TaxID=39478 RepID=A0A160NWI2_STRLU|nr:hypothetical protein SLA_1396 [Streptomyces laurentii]
MLAPESYFFFRSAASLSRAAPVTRLPFFRVSATRASSWEVRSGLLMITPPVRPGHPFDKVGAIRSRRVKRSVTAGRGSSDGTGRPASSAPGKKQQVSGVPRATERRGPPAEGFRGAAPEAGEGYETHSLR